MSKSKSAKSVAVGSAVVSRPTSLAARLSNSRGRIVGVTTVNSTGTRKFNGQIRSVGASFVTMFDRNQKRQVKFALNSVSSVTGV